MKQIGFIRAASACTAGVAIVATLAACDGGGDAPEDLSAAAQCAKLASSSLPNVTISTAELVAAGSFQPPTGSPIADLPEFCRVAAQIKNHPTSRIMFEAWLPTKIANKRFVQVGNGGYAGTIQYSAMATRLREGYATASTDDGTSAAPGVSAADRLTFLGDFERLYDFKGRAVTLTASASKALFSSFYKNQPAYSYFTGCSTGGLEALAVAQRMGSEFNGVSAGSPANNSAGLFSQAIWTYNNYQKISAKVDLIHTAVLAACDATGDGVVDGVVGNPEACSFDPASLRCTGADQPTCLTSEQVTATKNIYMGAVNPTTGTKTGEEYAPGMPYGSELIWSGSQAQATGTAQPWYGMVLNKTLTFNISAFDFNTDLSRALQLTIPYGAQVTNPDLSKFKEGGGKLILWAGWNDQLWSEANIVSYYKQVAAKMNGAGVDAISKTQDFSRLFMAPGMGHCGGGDGPNVLDTFPPLVDWVERGKAPDKIVAAKNLNNQAAQGVEKTRPICPYPQVAKWTGAGNANLADNYRCVSP